MRAFHSLFAAVLLPTLGLAQQDPESAWNDFVAANGPDWTVEWNPATGTPRAIFGPGLKTGGAIASVDEARTVVDGLLAKHANLLGRGRSEFVEEIGIKANKVHVFVYQQRYQGLEVISGRADVRLNEIGVVAMFGASAVAIPNPFNLQPGLTGVAAKAIAEGNVLGGPAKAQGGAAPRLVIFADTESPARTQPVLAWEVQIDERSTGRLQVGKAYVDAAGGAFLRFKDEVLYCSTCDTRHVFRAAPTRHAERMHSALNRGAAVRGGRATSAPAVALTGKVMAWTNLGLLPTAPLTNEPMANIQVTSSVGNAFTDASGNFSIPYTGTTPVAVTATLQGRHSSRVRVAQGTQLVASASVTPGTPATIQIGSPTMGIFDRAQTTTYWHTDDCNIWFRGLLPTATNQMNQLSTMNPQVNIASSCNAYYSNFTINFYDESASCNMTAFQTVIQHEWGHGADHAFGGISQTDGLSEGWGDILSLYRSGQSELGPGFRKGTTSGIRSGLNTRTYPAGGGVHQQGETWMGFAWDLRTNLIGSLGATAGAQRAEDIVIKSIAADATNQPNAVREVFILDDDDGNLLNGTPNYFDLEKAALKRRLPYPVRQNPNAGTYVAFGAGCKGSGSLPSNCLNVNDTGTPQNFGTRAGLIYAIGATAPTAMQVNGFDLYTSGGVTVPTYLYSATTNGQPNAIIARGSMVVGTTKGWYTTTFSPPVNLSSGQRFFVSFQNSSTTISASIRSGTNTPYFRNDGPSSSWNGPLGGFPWAYRVSCVGGTGAVPMLGNSGVPEVNQSFQINLSGAQPNGSGILIIGASDTTWNGSALPLDLTPNGAVGCNLLASLDIYVGINTDAGGTSAQNFLVPNVATLFGATFFNQYAITDSANAFGIVFSNGGRGKVGKQ